MSESRQGVFGAAKPAYTVHRFKRTIVIIANEEMAAELETILHANENAVKDEGGTVERHLYEFANQITDALDQQPPPKGEKPEVLAPGKFRKVGS